MASTLSEIFARRLSAGGSIPLEAAQELLDATIHLERAEHRRQFCEECEGEGEPEACEACFPAFDDARIMRRLALHKATGLPLENVLEAEADLEPLRKKFMVR